MSGAVDKRKHPRLHAEREFALKAADDAAAGTGLGRATFFYRTQDISAGGLCFQRDGELPIGTALRVFLNVHGALQALQIIGHTAVVRWCRRLMPGGPVAIGLEFIAPPEPNELAWEDYVNQLALQTVRT